MKRRKGEIERKKKKNKKIKKKKKEIVFLERRYQISKLKK
jgi:hypothetical protein